MPIIHSVFGSDFARYRTGEQEFAKALHEQCPDWSFIHSMSYLGASRREYREGESDFIVFIPNRGFIVIEVKAALRFERDHRGWARFNEAGQRVLYDTDPWRQASQGMHHLKDFLRRSRLCRDMNFGYGFAVCFPRADFAGPLLGIQRSDAQLTDADPNGFFVSATITQRDLPQLREVLTTDMDRWLSGRALWCDTDRMCRALAGHDPVELAPAAIARVTEVEHGLVRLTQEQVGALQLLTPQTPRVAVLGGPGTGKTIIARQQAKVWAQEGKRVLLLCFNRNLKAVNSAWLVDRSLDTLVRAETFHQFAHRMFREYGANLGFRWPAQPNNIFYEEECCRGLNEIMEMHSQRLGIDALVIDEAQDLNGLQIATLMNLRAKSVLLLSDPSQNLFAEPGAGDLTIPMDFARCQLTLNCRNSREIAWRVPMCVGNTPDERAVSRSPIADVRPRSLWNPLAVDRWALARAELSRWITQYQIAPSRIAVLCAREGSCREFLRDVGVVAGCRLTDELDTWRQNRGIFVSTIRSFKGLDATAVLLSDLERPPTQALTEMDVYVAVSRAKFDLAVLPHDMEAHRWFSDLFSGEIPTFQPESGLDDFD
jgi:hypothetical protein